MAEPIIFPWYSWFATGISLGVWMGSRVTAWLARRPRFALCALCRAELPHRSNVGRHEED